MSAKWRALQHRHRYTYSAVIFPHSYMNSLNKLPLENDLIAKFCSGLKELASLGSIYAQVNHVKNVGSSFGNLLASGYEDLVAIAARFYLEILFLENSVPLHRGLVSVLAKSRRFNGVIRGCFRGLCEEYGGLGGKGRRFCVSRVALSMMGTPKLGYLVDVVEECCDVVASDIVNGLESVVSEANSRARPSPLVMEQCQEALSCLYYLLQRFPSKFTDVGKKDQSLLAPRELELLEMVVSVVLSVLRSPAFSRDCFVAAGVSFCAALQVCFSPEELGCFILEGVFHQRLCNLTSGCNIEHRDSITKNLSKGDLCSEFLKLSPLSRLCLIRGILTAVSRVVLNTQFVVEIDSVNCVCADRNGENSTHIILYNSILPELCDYCESPTDSHFNFHALTVMQICLQQIKTSLLSDLVDRAMEINPIPEDLGVRIFRIVWNNLEDPLSQTVKQVHLIFDLFLDIQSTVYRSDASDRITSFLKKIAVDLLRLGPRCKGRYVPLASLTKRLGAKTILSMNRSLLYETVQAYIDDDVCCAATSFLKCFLENLRDECWSSNGIEIGYETYRGHCLPPFLCGLASGVSKLRSNLNTYALPSLFEVDVDSIFPMLAFLSVVIGSDTGFVSPEHNSSDITLDLEQQVAVLVSLLKVARFLALFEGDIDSCDSSSGSLEKCGLGDENAFVCIKGVQVKVPVKWLLLALTHVDESLRVDAAECLFLNPKTSSLPSSLELYLLRKSVPLNMRCCSTGFQMKWTSLFKKFFSRVRTALERQFKLGTWKPHAYYNAIASLDNEDERAVASRAEDLFWFMKWLSCFLFFSCYPSAPYERKIMAMELILIMINVWSIVPPLQGKSGLPSEDSLYPYNKGIILPDSTMLLVGSIIDSWDRLRESSFRILLNFPTPLPGISSECMIQEVISWAKNLVCSPRVRESDAGALMLRLIFRKYVLDFGWTVGVSASVCYKSESTLLNGEKISQSKVAVIDYINSLIDWLHIAVEEGEKDLSEACKNSFVHGILLTLRYTFEELDWKSDVVMYSISEMRHAMSKLLELIMRITSLALWVVSADAWYLPGDVDEMIDDDDFLSDLPNEMGMAASTTEREHDIKDLKVCDARPTEQIVMVGCWLAMKEVSLLLGTIIRKIPLPSSTPILEDETSNAAKDSMMPCSDAVLDVKQLEVIGNHFLEVLLKMKHNGAIDKTRAGFTALCNRLLCSDEPRLCQLTESWMEQLMERSVAKGQTVDDLLRRSAGIPAAFSAFFLSEPQGAPKKLLPRALRWLINIASGSLFNQTESSSTDDKISENLSAVSNQGNLSEQTSNIDSNIQSSKIRMEGVIPTVHAFNVLRAAFNDANLATDTSGFSAEAMIVSIRSFSSPHWEIRNSACLAYTSLVRRMVGFLNVHKRESARRALTSLEFFHRYPSLHSFVFSELKAATESLGDENSKSNLANVARPSLCPVLMLLSRLKPSPLASETGDNLDPFLFMPFIQRCSMQCNMRIRILASRAVTGLVSNEKLHTVLLSISSELPWVESPSEAAPSTTDAFYSANGYSCGSLNSIHGVLLQLSSLLDANCRNLADLSTKDAILGDLIKVLIKCSWIGSSKLCHCPILNSAFLSVLDHMLSIARTCNASKNYDVLSHLVSELSSECLAAEPSGNSFFYDPTVAELRKQAAISYFHCVYCSSEEHADEVLPLPDQCSLASNTLKTKSSINNGSRGIEKMLVYCMSDTSYEVRFAAFKWLLQFVKTADIEDLDTASNSSEIATVALWAKTNLQTTLIVLLSRETNHKCTYYILRILFAWNLLQFQKASEKHLVHAIYIGKMEFDSVLEFWNKLISMYEHARHTKTLETLVCCLGLCIRRFTTILRSNLDKRVPWFSNSEEFGEFTFLYHRTKHFVSLVKEYSDPSQPVNLRKAAAESLIASGLLGQAEFISSSVLNVHIPFENSDLHIKPEYYINMFAYEILEIWFTCIKLLEDEDVDLRRKLALDVQKCFRDGFQSGSHISSVPAQVEVAIELSFEFLSSLFGHWIMFFDYLSRWVLNAANSVTSKGDLVRRVFDKEIDNHHEEKLLICQICCFHLENLPISKSLLTNPSEKDEFLGFLTSWRARFLYQLTCFMNDHIVKMGQINWIGGIGNHKDAFLPLYANLLGIYVISKIILNEETEHGASLLSDVIELEKSIRPFLKNPLVYNIYTLVVTVHEEAVGDSANNRVPEIREGCHMWDGFDPYFLLR